MNLNFNLKFTVKAAWRAPGPAADYDRPLAAARARSLSHSLLPGGLINSLINYFFHANF
jgi:hypothetical protein